MKGNPRIHWRRSIPALVLFVILVGLWQAAWVYGPQSRISFASPSQVLASLNRLAGDGSLWPSVVATLRRLFVGFFTSVLIGGTVALLMARFLVVRRAVKPYLLGFQSLPSIAWVPLAILWFGLEETSFIFVTVMGSVFAVTIAFTDALMSVRPAHLMAARNMGSSGLGLITRVMIPAALPPLTSGAKQCWSFAWRSLIGAEMLIFTSVGLGFLLDQGRIFSPAQVFAVMLVTLAIGWLFEMFAFARAEAWVRRRWGLPTV